MQRVPARAAGHQSRFAFHLLQAYRAHGPVVLPPDGRLMVRPVGARQQLVKPLARPGAGQDVRGHRRAQEARELARPQRPPPDACVVQGATEDTEDDEQDVLAGHGAVGAGAGWDGCEGHLVHIAGGTQDEEVGIGAVDEAERVAQGTDDPVGYMLGQVISVSVNRMGIGWWGVGTYGLH